MPKDPKSTFTEPSSKKRDIPMGASWDAENARIDNPAPDKAPSEEQGPEFPQTAAARPHTVTDEKLPNASVVDKDT